MAIMIHLNIFNQRLIRKQKKKKKCLLGKKKKKKLVGCCRKKINKKSLSIPISMYHMEPVDEKIFL